jgi:membrane protease subunit HflK
MRDLCPAVLREVVATRSIDEVLTVDKGVVEDEGRAQLQEVLDGWGAGIEVLNVQLQDVEAPAAVREAFADVASAEQDRERLILEARGYAEQIVPQARGEAQELRNRARAYRDALVLRARGEAARFSALLAEYRRAPGVTRERLYLETVEEVLPRTELVIIENGSGERVLPYLPLPRGKATAP